MRFAALQGGGVSDYAAAGKKAANAAAESFATTRKHGPNYDDIAQTGMKARSAEKIKAMQTGAQVTKAGITAVANVTKTQIQEQAKIDVRKAKTPNKMAGGIAAIGKIGAMAMLSKDNTKGREMPSNTQAKKDAWNKFHEETKTKNAERDANRTEFKPTTFDPGSPSGASAGSRETPGKVTVGGGNASISGDSFDMSKLSTKDYDDLAFAVSSEAQLGTDDEYGVAANILTRLRSGKYGDNVSSIIHAPGQYEGVYTGRSVASPQISARFQTPEGRAKIQEFMTRLDGRTEFKGQSMLHNRVSAEDPMFSSGGNFYHYAGQ